MKTFTKQELAKILDSHKFMTQELNELCMDCPILNICRKEDCVGVCEDDTRSQREMIRDASHAHEQANGADYGNV